MTKFKDLICNVIIFKSITLEPRFLKYEVKKIYLRQ